MFPHCVVMHAAALLEPRPTPALYSYYGYAPAYSYAPAYYADDLITANTHVINGCWPGGRVAAASGRLGVAHQGVTALRARGRPAMAAPNPVDFVGDGAEHGTIGSVAQRPRHYLQIQRGRNPATPRAVAGFSSPKRLFFMD